MSYTPSDFTAKERAVLIPSLAFQVNGDYSGIKNLTGEQKETAAFLVDRFAEDDHKPLAKTLAVPAFDMSHVQLRPHERDELGVLLDALLTEAK